MFSRFSRLLSKWAGTPAAFVLATLSIVVWAACGPLFHYSDTWQLIANTGTTIVTFLLCFLIQNSQNRDGAAIQAKLDNLIKAIDGTDERLHRIEDRTEDEIESVRT